MIEKTALGDTSILISRVGLGTVKFGRNQGVRYPQAFDLPTNHACFVLLDQAKNLGINLLDTAPAYGTSEERLGKLLVGQRQQWVLCTKVGEEFENGKSSFDFSKAAVQQSIERSLKRLRTDVLDIALVHSNGEDEKIIQEDEIFLTLSELKQAGKIRAFGMSCKTVAGGLAAVEHGDVVMVTYNPMCPEDQPVIAAAKKKNKGVLIKKALASGHLAQFTAPDPVLAAMKFVFAEPGTTSVIIGTLDANHLQHNVECAEQCL